MYRNSLIVLQHYLLYPTVSIPALVRMLAVIEIPEDCSWMETRLRDDTHFVAENKHTSCAKSRHFKNNSLK